MSYETICRYSANIAESEIHWRYWILNGMTCVKYLCTMIFDMSMSRTLSTFNEKWVIDHKQDDLMRIIGRDFGIRNASDDLDVANFQWNKMIIDWKPQESLLCEISHDCTFFHFVNITENRRKYQIYATDWSFCSLHWFSKSDFPMFDSIWFPWTNRIKHCLLVFKSRAIFINPWNLLWLHIFEWVRDIMIDMIHWRREDPWSIHNLPKIL
jgi:hypothetical protein